MQQSFRGAHHQTWDWTLQGVVVTCIDALEKSAGE